MNIEIKIVILVVLVISFFVYRIKRRKSRSQQTTPQIQLEELPTAIDRLLNRELSYEFFGITSIGIDCLYFVNDNGLINIEYEVVSEEQKAYVEKITDFSKENNFQLIETTYGNRPIYSGVKFAPVYRIEINAEKIKATEIGTKIMTEIFNNDGMTKFDIVP